MTQTVRWVRNRATGLVHSVPEGHFALADPEYEQVEAVCTQATADPKPARTRSRTKKHEVTNDGT